MTSSKSKYAQMDILGLRVELANYIKANAAQKSEELGNYTAYLAGPWFTSKDKDVMEYIQSEVHKYDCIEVYFPIEHSFESPRHTFNENVKAIKNADIVVALIMSKDVGTAMEIGYAKAIGKPIYLVVYDESCLNYKTNIMLAYAADEVIALEDLISMLRGIPVNTYKIKDTWEGKQ